MMLWPIVEYFGVLVFWECIIQGKGITGISVICRGKKNLLAPKQGGTTSLISSTKRKGGDVGGVF